MLQNAQVPCLYAIVYPTSFDFIGQTRGNHQPLAKNIQHHEEIIFSCRRYEVVCFCWRKLFTPAAQKFNTLELPGGNICLPDIKGLSESH